MRASQTRMLRRRRRTFLCAGILTVVGVITAQRSGADPPPADMDAVSSSIVLAPGMARLFPLSDGEPIVRPVAADPAEGSVRGDAVRLHRCPPDVRACVDLEARSAWLQRGGQATYGPVVIGQGPDHYPTPRGRFHVLWKTVDYTSRRYGIAMPYSVFFASDGIAFHEGALDQPSHGCVHLTPGAARAFFAALESGDEVYVA